MNTENRAIEKINTNDKQVRAFINYVKGVVNKEDRATNLTFSDNGAIVPTTIAQRIIEEVKNISDKSKQTFQG